MWSAWKISLCIKHSKSLQGLESNNLNFYKFPWNFSIRLKAEVWITTSLLPKHEITKSPNKNSHDLQHYQENTTDFKLPVHREINTKTQQNSLPYPGKKSTTTCQNTKHRDVVVHTSYTGDRKAGLIDNASGEADQ